VGAAALYLALAGELDGLLTRVGRSNGDPDLEDVINGCL